jgi:hypothetical protein
MGNHAFLEESKMQQSAKSKTIQNPYSLLNRLFLKMLPLKFACEKM